MEERRADIDTASAWTAAINHSMPVAESTELTGAAPFGTVSSGLGQASASGVSVK
jgi:hypothetical protein